MEENLFNLDETEEAASAAEPAAAPGADMPRRPGFPLEKRRRLLYNGEKNRRPAPSPQRAEMRRTDS